jgi:hypothetical protein
MNGAANERARAEAERVAAAAAGNQGGPPDASPVVPPAAAAAALPLPVAGPVIIGAAALAQILAAVQQQQPQVAEAGAPLHERAGSTRLKAFSSTDAVEWMSWKTHYLEVCEINAWPNIRRVREAWAAISEKAARHMADKVPVYVANLAANPPVQITTWQELIARYQEKLITQEKVEEAVGERAEEAAVAVQKGEKEKQASDGSATPPPTRSLLAQFRTRH